MRQQKVTARSKLNGQQCPLCRRVLRMNEAALVVSEAYRGYVYHRDCVERYLADTPYDGNPSAAVQVEEQFETLRKQLNERYS